MAQLIGKVYNIALSLKDKEGKTIAFDESNWEEKLEQAENARVHGTIGTRKALKSDNENENLTFTEIVVFQKRLAKIIYKHFGKPEHKGKWAVLYGQFNDRKWTPDPNKENELKYCQKETLYKADLEALGFKFAEGSKEKVSFYVSVPQVSKQLVVNNFEFVGDDTAPASSESGTPTRRGFKFVTDDEEGAESTVPAGAKDSDDPF